MSTRRGTLPPSTGGPALHQHGVHGNAMQPRRDARVASKGRHRFHARTNVSWVSSRASTGLAVSRRQSAYQSDQSVARAQRANGIEEDAQRNYAQAPAAALARRPTRIHRLLGGDTGHTACSCIPRSYVRQERARTRRRKSIVLPRRANTSGAVSPATHSTAARGPICAMYLIGPTSVVVVNRIVS